jgi:hypothetical protein
MVPPEVRSLLRHLRETGIVIGGTLTVAGFGAFAYADILVSVLEQALADADIGVVSLLVFIAGGFLSYPVRLVSMSRRAIRKGLGLADVRSALGDEASALNEELELDDEGRKRRVQRQILGMRLFPDVSADAKKAEREKWIRRGPMVTRWGSILFLGVGVNDVLIDLIFGVGVNPEFVISLIPFAIMIITGLLLIGAGPSVEEDSPLRALPIAERLLVGRFGGLLFRVASIGIKQPAPTAPTNQLTEAFLASAADQIFERLPKEVRWRFAEVPAVIERLEAAAKGLRKRDESLSRAVAEAAPEAAPRNRLAARRYEAVGDLEAARDRARASLEETVAALENLRLDLLRLHAGIGSPDDLTAALEKAREMGDAIDAELAGQSEVRMLLAGEES